MGPSASEMPVRGLDILLEGSPCRAGIAWRTLQRAKVLHPVGARSPRAGGRENAARSPRPPTNPHQLLWRGWHPCTTPLRRNPASHFSDALRWGMHWRAMQASTRRCGTPHRKKPIPVWSYCRKTVNPPPRGYDDFESCHFRQAGGTLGGRRAMTSHRSSMVQGRAMQFDSVQGSRIG